MPSTKDTLFVRSLSKSRIPRLPYLDLKNAVLGKNYDLSVAFVSQAESKRLNRLYRHKNKPANILSFPLTKNSGEIVICQAKTRAEEKKFGYRGRDMIAFLFIHGLFHLKGLRHGSKMEDKEAAVRKKFGLPA